MSAFSARLAGVATESPGSSCPCAAWECAAPRSRRASPTACRGSRCAGRAAPGSSRRRRLRWPLDLQLHQSLGGKANHLAQQLGVRALFQERAKVHHPVGHRVPRIRLVSQPDLGESSMRARFAHGFATPSYTTTRDLTASLPGWVAKIALYPWYHVAELSPDRRIAIY